MKIKTTIIQLSQSKLFATVLFCAFSMAFLWKAGYGKLTFERPGSIHQWRQCDGASLALIYHQDGNALWEPMMHNQLNGEGRAGGEFPLFYYTAGKLYSLFGPKEIIIRLMHLGVFMCGLFVLYFAFLQACPIPVLAPIPFVLIWSSPSLLYYTNNFLPDGPGLGFTFLGIGLIWFYFLRKKDWLFFASMISFSLAALVKVSMLLPFIALILVGILLKIQKNNTHTSNSSEFSRWQWIWGLTIVFIPAIIWYTYIRGYNDAHGGIYFSTAIKPIWLSSSEEISATFDAFVHTWLPIIWPTPTRILLVISMLAFMFFGVRHVKRPIWVFVLLLILGTIAYAMAFFTPLVDHDYYYLVFMIAPLFTCMYAIYELAQHLVRYQSNLISISLVLCFIATTSLVYSSGSEQMWSTYMNWFDQYTLNSNLNDMDPWLTSHGVSKDDKVISLPDPSSNQSLYLMNRKGWSGLTGLYNSDDADSVIKYGAQYAVITDTSFHAITFLQYHIKDTVGYHGDIGVYKIEKSETADF